MLNNMMEMHSGILFICFLVSNSNKDYVVASFAAGAETPQKTIKVIPEATMTIDQMIHYHGYKVESHDVTTSDGFILTLKRIPHGRKNVNKKSTPVFLQHGLLDSASTWVLNGADKSLAYILADEGYDVWLGNSRGNTYSRRHTQYSTYSNHFWDFSFEEMAKYDLPASIDYVTKTTNGSQIYYVGHSQGTLIGFIEFSRNVELSKKIKQFIALAPVATVDHVQGLFKYISGASRHIELILKALGVREFLPSSWITKLFAKFICSLPVGDVKCAGIIFLIAGFNTNNLDLDRVSVYLSHTPAGTSVKDLIHFAQVKRSGSLQYYDYGFIKNYLKYGQGRPPKYDISKMVVPVSLFTATNDWLAPPADVNKSIRNVLPNIIYDENFKEYNHLDFVWGKDANHQIYSKIITLFSKA